MSNRLQGKAVLKIGQHELRGNVVKFDKPLAVLKKVSSGALASGPMDMDVDHDPSLSSTAYEVVGVVRQKFLFKDRPKVLLELATN